MIHHTLTYFKLSASMLPVVEANMFGNSVHTCCSVPVRNTLGQAMEKVRKRVQLCSTHVRRHMHWHHSTHTKCEVLLALSLIKSLCLCSPVSMSRVCPGMAIHFLRAVAMQDSVKLYAPIDHAVQLIVHSCSVTCTFAVQTASILCCQVTCQCAFPALCSSVFPQCLPCSSGASCATKCYIYVSFFIQLLPLSLIHI